MPAVTAPVSTYTRDDAARILRVPQRQLALWQRAGLMPHGNAFTIRDLASMRSVRELRQQRISVRSIQNSITAMQLAGIADPLRDSIPIPRGARLIFRHGGALLDPLTQQLAFDFDRPPQLELVKLAAPRAQQLQAQLQAQLRAQELFTQAVLLEEKPGCLPEATALYKEVLQLHPRHAAASINLGTILYNDRKFAEAEQRYRTAAEIDPGYALAFFDLGNVLDELRRLPEAIAAYARAIQLVPTYADAHYNLALAYERAGERRRALRHWLHYVRLDPVGPWATHARLQAKRTLATERLSIVARGGKRA